MHNDEYSKLKVRDHVRISKYRNILVKVFTRNWSEEVFLIKKVKNNVPWTNIISDLNREEIVGTFYEKDAKKTNPKEFRIKEVIMRS